MDIKYFHHIPNFFNRNDWRLTFSNLKKDGTRKNLIGEEERKIIWIPELIFDNGILESKVNFHCTIEYCLFRANNLSTLRNLWLGLSLDFLGQTLGSF